MVSLRGDDPISIDVRGTALDVLGNTENLVVGGSNSLSVLTLSSTSANTWVKLRSNRSLVRLLKFNPLSTGYFASVSRQFIDVYSLGQGSHIQRLATFTAHSRKVSDFCWCPFDDQLMITCAESDSVNFWDLRTDLSKPTARLGVTFGAGQSKFAPHLNNYLLTTHGTDVRLWDLRHTSHPIVQFKAHQTKVLCLDWHPHHQEPNSFFTSANDAALKLWNMTDQKSAPSMVSMAPFSAWRLVFSHEGEELAALGLPPVNALALYSNYGLENPRLLKGIERDTLMDAAWHKSTTAHKSTTKFLYTLSAVKQRLCRHAIAYELSNELRDEMATPITQSKTDEERDRLVAAAEQAVDPDLLQMGGGSMDDVAERMHQRIPTDARSSISGRSIIVGSSSLKKGSAMMAGGGGGGGTTPQSPIYSEWQRWIRAPNVAGGDLLTELEALRKHTAEGLYTTEVNFTRAAIGFSYMHLNKYRKINFEMRFHREFIDNGLVFVEVLQKDCPLSAEKASLFLTLLQQEGEDQLRLPADQTILCRVLQQLPRIIDLLKVFTPSMDVPSLSKTSSQSGSASEEQFMSSALAIAGTDPMAITEPTTSRTISAAVPCSYIPSPYDHRVPAPRNCGARFNRSGYLVVFGPVNTIGRGEEEGIPRIVPHQLKGRRMGGTSSTRLGSTRSHLSEGKVHPRSLAEYCVLVNPAPGTAASLRQVSTSSAHAPFQSSPPVRCISPGSCMGRPISPLSGPGESMPVGAESGRQGQQQQNSLSPPSLLRQNAPQFEQPDEGGQRAGASLARPIAGTSPRILGSSPSTSSAVRSFSLQNVAHSIRHRGSSMSGAISSASAALAPSDQQPGSSSTQANVLFAQQQSVIEHGSSSGPAAVMPEQTFNSVVTVYDATTLLPISRPLARSYKLLGQSPLALCRHNFEQSARLGREDLMAVWRLLEQCIQAPPRNELNGRGSSRAAQFARFFRIEEAKVPRAIEAFASVDVPWAVHPFGRELVGRLLEHFTSKFDLQTAAVITCIVGQEERDRENGTAIAAAAPLVRPAALTRPTSTTSFAAPTSASEPATALDARIPLPPLSIPPSRKTSSTLPNVPPSTSANAGIRSFVADNFGSSRAKQSMDRLSPAPEHFSSPSPPTKAVQAYPLPGKEPNSELFLDPSLSNRFEELRKKYADILYRWRLYKKCAEVLKHCRREGEDSLIGTIKAASWCSFCGEQQRGEGSGKCANAKCRRLPIYCAICELPCRGVIATCTSCGHGGHFLHISGWFDAQAQCPLGCGCDCKF